jgi:hypothetical protein
MDTNRIPKQALQYRPKGRRNVGRPKKRWRDQLHFEDQGTGNTPNPSRTWWWWWIAANKEGPYVVDNVQNLQVSQSEQIIDSWWRYPLLVLSSLATSMVVTQCLLYPGQGHRTARSRANRLTERGISTDHDNSDPDIKFWCFSCTALCSSEQSFCWPEFSWVLQSNGTWCVRNYCPA